MGYFRRIDRIVWKPISWYPESPDQYPGGLGPAFKPETCFVPLKDGRVWFVAGDLLAPTMRVCVNWCPGHLEWLTPDELEGEAPTGGEAPADMRDAFRDAYAWAEGAEHYTDENGRDYTVFAPGGEDRRTIELPADKESVLDIVDALLYIQRRTHEHDWQGPDDGLAEELEAG